jgi:imidazolonepropionase-like amidohydrolase
LAIVGGRVIPVAGAPFEDGVVLIADGRIEAAGRDLRVPEGVERVDAAGKVVLPGLIDAHVHLGVHEEGDGWAGQDTNELTDPVTPHVRALDAINPADLGFADAVAGGVLTVNVNPGSGNPIGGQTAAVRSAGRSVDEMVLRAPSGMKSALGENPKRVYGEKKQFPSTRLGTAAAIRDAFVKTANYLAKRDHDGDEPAERDLRWEALGLVLAGEIPWRQHCHRADDIATALRLADEFGYRLVIDHGTEAVLLADRLAERGVPVLIGPLLTSRSKVELRNRSLANPARLAAAGVELGIITDHPVVPIHLLHVQAALAVREGLDPAAALRAVTLTPARVLGLDDRLGSLEPGKHATLCIWSGDPLDARSRVESAWIEGRQVYSTGPDGPSAF